jgi:hypothetical protein
VPAAQLRAPLATAGHTLPQAPQCSADVLRFAHETPQRTSPTPQPLAHANPPPVASEHTGVDIPQALPQRPQLVALAKEASQPVPGIPSQSP